MSNAHPSPPRIQTLLRTSVSAMASRLRASDELEPASFSRRIFTRSRCALISGSVFCDAAISAVDELVSDRRGHPLEEGFGEGFLLVEGDAHAETEFGVVFEERVGPRRPAALHIMRVWRRGQIAAIDR